MSQDYTHRQHGALVFIETSGNQAYLYATNKLRENIGASQLTYLAGKVWVEQAVGNRTDVDTIVATSGKALLLVPTPKDGRAIVRDVTARAAREAPGLSITGAVVDIVGDESKAVKKAYKRFNANRDAMTGSRFPTLPWCEPCATSGLPALGQAKEGDKSYWYSAASIAKRNHTNEWYMRIRDLFRRRGKQEGEVELFIESNIEKLQKRFEDSQWLGVIFSDGNGLGQIFMDLNSHLDRLRKTDGPDWTYFEAMKNFSRELQDATENAFYAACDHIHRLGASVEATRRGSPAEEQVRIPVIPLVLAGDDMTVMVQGEYALPFTAKFLEAFEEETEGCETISTIAEVALGAPRLSAGAGVALVKHHFPFHLAHQLAEDLLKSAKLAKKEVISGEGTPFPVSALDFHVMFDASHTRLDAIRAERLSRQDGGAIHRLYGGPYVVTPTDKLANAEAAGGAWAKTHALDGLFSRVGALNAQDHETGRLKLPSSQMHTLRAALGRGKDFADARLSEMHWLDERGLRTLKEDGGSLFTAQPDIRVTRFADALNVAGFWSEEHADAGVSSTRNLEAES